jgi:hypothetical protein
MPEDIEPWVATVIVESIGAGTNEVRLASTAAVVESILSNMSGCGAVVFPGGWLDAGEKEACTEYPRAEEEVASALKSAKRDVVVCLGVDGYHEQIAAAIGREGIVALGRKFIAAPKERDVILAANYRMREQNKERLFRVGSRAFFLCACYDAFGIKEKKLARPAEGVDAILDLVHAFWPAGKGVSGNGNYARKVMGGASKEWGCSIFGSAVFFNRPIPTLWPSGILWNKGNMRTMDWKYQDNPMLPTSVWSLEIPEGKALVRTFSLPQAAGSAN